MGLGLYIVAFLVNSIENDPDRKTIKLVQKTFKAALSLKIKQRYPTEVKQMKYELKFRKNLNLMLNAIARAEGDQADLHEKNLQFNKLYGEHCDTAKSQQSSEVSNPSK